MSWAAYAFVNEDQSDSKNPSEGGPAGWGAVVRQSLPLIVADEDVPFGIVSDVGDIEFCEVKDVEEKASFARGRIFGSLGELRWRAWCRGRHAVLLTDADTDRAALLQIGFDDGQALDLVAEDSVSYLLWGDLEADGRWRDGRIPRDLAYPVAQGEEGERVWLRVKRYVDDAGVVQFARYMGVTSERREPS